MGSSASRREARVQRRLRAVVEKEVDREHVGRANALIDDPVLADLRHGTIRYRKESTAAAEASAAGTPVRSGYFYHARLADNTPGGVAVAQRADPHKFLYVTRGPAKHTDRIFYVYSSSKRREVVDRGVVRREKPRGVGAPEFRVIEHLAYDVQFVSQDDSDADDSDADDSEEDSLDGAENGGAKRRLRVRVQPDDTVLRAKEAVCQLLLPAIVSVDGVNLVSNGSDMQDSALVVDYAPVLSGPDTSTDFFISLSLL